MNRRRFLTLGLSAAALPALSACGLPSRYWDGSYRHYEGSRVNHVHRVSAPYKMYYHGNTLAFLLPDLHMMYQHVGFDTVLGSHQLFGGIPEGILNKGYLQHDDERINHLLFYSRSFSTQAMMQVMFWGITAAELTKAENAAMQRLINQYQPGSLQRLAVRQVQNSELIVGNAWQEEHPAPAIANHLGELGYKHSFGGTGELYAAGSYPAGFFDGARIGAYEPFVEIHGSEPITRLPEHYAWQERTSPVHVHPNGRVTLNGQTMHRFNPRSFSGERFK